MVYFRYIISTNWAPYVLTYVHLHTLAIIITETPSKSLSNLANTLYPTIIDSRPLIPQP